MARRRLQAELKARRLEAIDLVEPLSIRTPVIQSLVKRLEPVSARLTELLNQLREIRGTGWRRHRA